MQVLDMQHNRTWMRGSLIHAQQNFAPHHHASDFGLVGLASYQVARVLATPQHGDVIREFQHLTQFVGNKDNSFTFIYQATQDTKKLKGLLWCQNTRWLVHNQNVSSAVEHFENLDALL